MTHSFRPKILAHSIALGWLAAAAFAPLASAAEVTVLDTVTVSTQSGAYRSEKNSASAVAPTQSSLLA
ncbi:hypothetical protein ACVBEH_27245, partial [Roseateles sp. GG27B]